MKKRFLFRSQCLALLIYSFQLLPYSGNYVDAQQSVEHSKTVLYLKQKLTANKTFKALLHNIFFTRELLVKSARDTELFTNTTHLNAFNAKLGALNPNDRNGVVDFFNKQFIEENKIVNSFQECRRLAKKLTNEVPELTKLSGTEVHNILYRSVDVLLKADPTFFNLRNEVLHASLSNSSDLKTAETRAECLERHARNLADRLSSCSSVFDAKNEACVATFLAASVGCAVGSVTIIGGIACWAGITAIYYACLNLSKAELQKCRTDAEIAYRDGISSCPPEANFTTYYHDGDGDGYGDPGSPYQVEQGKNPPPGYVLDNTDCDDSNAEVHEKKTFYKDNDGDGYGGDATQELCASTAPAGYADQSGDCDDNDAEVHEKKTFYVDSDGDGYGGDAQAEICASTAPAGYSEQGGDCDDNDAEVHEKKTFYKDNDGDGYGGDATEELCASTPPEGYSNDGSDCDDNDPEVHINNVFYGDNDGDGYGDGHSGIAVFCLSTPPPGYVFDNSDCDDSDPEVHEEKTFYVDSDGDGYGGDATQELCASTAPAGYADQSGDCDDEDPEVHEEKTFYVDSDGDGYGDGDSPKEICTSTAPEGYSEDGTDCDDSDPEVHEEKTFYVDSDGDGYGGDAAELCASEPPEGYVDNSEDCDDSDPNKPDPISCDGSEPSGGGENGAAYNQLPKVIGISTIPLWYHHIHQNGNYMIGGYLGWRQNAKLTLGIGGYYLVKRDYGFGKDFGKNIEYISKTEYGGLLIQYELFRQKYFSVNISNLLGGGVSSRQLKTSRAGVSQALWKKDYYPVFVLQPSVNLEFRLSKQLHFGIGGGYYYIFYSGKPVIGNNYISSPFIKFDLRFGSFK